MANGTIVNFTYDNRGNVTKIDYPNMADVSYTYNNLNQVATMTDGIGTTTYGYDTMGRLTSVDGPWSNDTITYSYDALGRRSELNLNGNVTYYDYDSLSRLTSVTHGSNTFNYSYNGASGQLNHVTLPNGTKSTFSYDSLGRLNNVQDKVVSGGANISQFTYGYDNRDVQTSVERALGTASSQMINYTYDDINQLTGETSTETTPLINNSYTYDDAGNRLTSSTSGTESTFTLDQMNQISGYTLGGNPMDVDYDDNGNTTQLGFQTMTYDDADRLTSVIQKNPLTGDNVKKTEYEYDGLSRKSTSTSYTWNAGNETWDQQNERRFIYDGMDLIEERDGSNNVIASYVRDGNIGGVLSRTTSSGTFYYHYDGNGNVVAMTNASGVIVAEYTYDAYGNLTAMSGSQAADNPIRFSTKYFDSNTGYYNFGFRSYDPVTGRWLNRDPIGEQGGLNLYGFVGNSPGNGLDAYGLAQFGIKPFGDGVPFLGLTSNFANWLNLAVGHEQLFFEDGKNPKSVGFERVDGIFGLSKGRRYPAEDAPASEYIFDDAHYSDSIMRRAVANVGYDFNYSLLGNNCQTWADRVKDEYARLGGRVYHYPSKFSGYKVPGFLEYSLGDVFKNAPTYNSLAKSYLRGLGY